MIRLENVKSISGERTSYTFKSDRSALIDGSSLTALPAGIDPHVHFRTPGAEHKENWESAAAAAIAGGITTVLDMPNNQPACTSLLQVGKKRALIDRQLQNVGIPLRYGLYLGADSTLLDEIPKAAEAVCALKIYMGNSTGNLVMEERWAIERAFELAASCDLLVAVHAEDEQRLSMRAREWNGKADPALHSLIRDPEAARIACAEAIELAAKYRASLYIAHCSTRGELDLIAEAKRSGVRVYAEATHHHLFLDKRAYARLGSYALVNPPLRDPEDREALWAALTSGLIDTVGSDHAPHTRAEKELPFGKAPSGMPGVDLIFPLLLTQVVKEGLSIDRFLELTRTRAEAIFSLPSNNDLAFVDLDGVQTAGKGKSRCGWSPYEGMALSGWPRYVAIDGRLFEV